MYVVEEPKAEERLDTQYVTDVVVRLRIAAHPSYSRRTVEIEKARGHKHVRGRHDIAIRPGGGSTTGTHSNPDDPAAEITRPGKTKPDSLAYVHVFRSLHALSRELLTRKGRDSPQVNPDRGEVFGFGITYLDRLLPHDDLGKDDAAANKKHQQLKSQIDGTLEPSFWLAPAVARGRGLVGGTVNALIGPLTTHKSRLARAFLAQAIQPALEPNGTGGGVAVLLTTQPMDGDVLLKEMLAHLEPQTLDPARQEEVEGRIICRRMEARRCSRSA